MLTIKSIVVKNMKKITLIMVMIILFLSTLIQAFGMQRAGREDARQIFSQVEQILDENSRELERTVQEYNATCLNDARTVAYILGYNPEARDSVEELKKIAKNVEVDEIHIFDTNGVIVAGTHPEYFGYSFASGEQMAFFEPLLADRSLELVQDVMPNTAEGKMVQYSALWSEDGSFIVQVGMDPSTVLRAAAKNELSHIFSLLRTGIGFRLYAVRPDTGSVIGATVVSDLDKDAEAIGLSLDQLKSEGAFYASVDQTACYCMSRQIEGNYIVWAMPLYSLYESVLTNGFLLLGGLALISVILVYAVTNTMNRTVIEPIEKVSHNLWTIGNGDLKTKVEVNDSKEFSELSAHINSMVESLLKSSKKLVLSERIKSQKEELERQHEKLEAAVERAEAANEAKSKFLFNMSHDIRTPMNAIIGFTNLALESGSLETKQEYLKNIDVSSKQLLDLIDNILELCRIETNRIIIEEELVNIEESLQKMRTMFESDLQRKQLAYTVRVNVYHSYVYMDAARYSQIVLNLVSNAIKYTSSGGAITVSVRELPVDDPDFCLLETVVEDNGIGMSKEFLSHAYESFARERTSTESGIRGTGLGLVIVKNLVDLMRGTVEIESELGEGTRVIVCLPHRLGKAPPETVQEGTKVWDSSLFQGKRILMAEDIDINAMITTKILTSRGFLVDRARDGVECIDLLRKAEDGYYDFILMDIQMPNMDGYKAARFIRAMEDKAKASIPILALTANAFPEDCGKAMEAGMDCHIAKPLDAAKLFQAIAEVLQKKRKA